MNDVEAVCLRQIIPPSAVSGSCRIRSDKTGFEFLLISAGNVLSFRKTSNPLESSHSINVPGVINSVIPIADRNQVFVLYRIAEYTAIA